MQGAHGMQPDGHEHVRCRFCGRTDVHTTLSLGTVNGVSCAFYAGHNMPGDAISCPKSRGRVVWDEDRHQADPGGEA